MPIDTTIRLLLSWVRGTVASPEISDPEVWENLRQAALGYGLGPLLAYSIRKFANDEQRSWCDRILTKSWVRHDRMVAHMTRVAGLLRTGGVECIALKGPALAVRYYSPAFLRKPSMDLDFAVRQSELEDACRILALDGYVADTSVREARARSHHVVFAHPSRPPVELHFRLSHNNAGVPTDFFFGKTIPCGAEGINCQVLAPGDQLFHLILHLAQSRFGSLFHLCEVERVAMAEPPDVLKQAIRRAVDWNFRGAFRMADIAFRARLGRPLLPDDADIPKTWLNWRLTPALYAAFERSAEPGMPFSLMARLRGRWLDFQTTDRPGDALRSVLLMAQLARFNFGRARSWGTPKTLHYSHEDRKPAATRPDHDR